MVRVTYVYWPAGPAGRYCYEASCSSLRTSELFETLDAHRDVPCCKRLILIGCFLEFVFNSCVHRETKKAKVYSFTRHPNSGLRIT